MLGPEETKKLYPLMNVTDVYGTLYSPEDGTIDPAGYCTALSRAAKQRGAQVSWAVTSYPPLAENHLAIIFLVRPGDSKVSSHRNSC